MQKKAGQNLRQDRPIIVKLQDTYTNIYDNKKKLRKGLIVLAIICSAILLLYSYLNYDFSYFFRKELLVALAAFILVLLFKLFHELFGKWIIHANRERLSIRFVKEKLPRIFKTDGYTGAGKDSTINAIKKHFRDDIIEKLEDTVSYIQDICYPYDFDALNEHLDLNHEDFYTNSKSKFFSVFIDMMKNNNCFLKKWYIKDLVIEDHIKDMYKIQKNPYDLENNKIKYQYNDLIRPKHFLNLLIKYCMQYIRINYLNNYILTNQPTMETRDNPAMLFSTKFTNIHQENSEWPWPIGGGVIIVETEADGLYPNTGMKKNNKPIKTGLRNTKAFNRHLFGEHSVWITIGQRSSRTEKTLRELDHSFLKIIEQTKVYGGEKRIFFLRKYLSWAEFWVNKSIRKKSKEKQIRRKSKLLQKITRLENTGYIYADVKISMTDTPTLADEISLSKIFRYDKPIRESYTIKFCFKLIDFYFGYNTHYIESIAEDMAKKSNIQLHQVMKWDPDLILKKKHVIYMDYPVLDSMMRIDRYKIEQKLKNQIKKNKKDKEIKQNGEEKES